MSSFASAPGSPRPGRVFNLPGRRRGEGVHLPGRRRRRLPRAYSPAPRGRRRRWRASCMSINGSPADVVAAVVRRAGRLLPCTLPGGWQRSPAPPAAGRGCSSTGPAAAAAARSPAPRGRRRRRLASCTVDQRLPRAYNIVVVLLKIIFWVFRVFGVLFWVMYDVIKGWRRKPYKPAAIIGCEEGPGAAAPGSAAAGDGINPPSWIIGSWLYPHVGIPGHEYLQNRRWHFGENDASYWTTEYRCGPSCATGGKSTGRLIVWLDRDTSGLSDSREPDGQTTRYRIFHDIDVPANPSAGIEAGYTYRITYTFEKLETVSAGLGRRRPTRGHAVASG